MHLTMSRRQHVDMISRSCRNVRYQHLLNSLCAAWLAPVCPLEHASFQQCSYMYGWPKHESAAGRPLGVICDADKNWSLLWADEFEGSALDASSWTPLEGDGSAYGIPGMAWWQLLALPKHFSCMFCAAPRAHCSTACVYHLIHTPTRCRYAFEAWWEVTLWSKFSCMHCMTI